MDDFMAIPQDDGTVRATPEKPGAAKTGAKTAEAAAPDAVAVPIVLDVTSHMPRERVFDDKEQRIVAGRLWLISFTDLFSILLCFFLMLYSMKDPDLAKIAKMMGTPAKGMSNALGQGQAGGEHKAVNINRVEYGQAINLDYLQGVLKASLSEAKLDKDVRISAGRDHLKLTIDDSDLFNGASLTPSGGRLVRDLGGRLMLLSNRITVVGLPGSGDAGEWAATLAKAGAFGAMMQEGGYRKPFIVIGAAAGRGPAIEIRVEADDGRER